MDLESVSLVTTIEDTIDDKASSPLDHQEEPHADKQGITYQDDENGHFSYPMDQRRLSLTDLQDEAIYAFGTRLSVITEVSKEDSSNQVMTIHPSPTTRDKKESNDEAFHHGAGDESVAGSDESVAGVPRRCSSEPAPAEQPHAVKQGITYQDDEYDHFPSPMEQRRLSLTDLQNEAIYAFGTRLSVITEVSNEDSSNQVMTIHPSPTTIDEKESNDEAFQHGGSDESVAGVPRPCSSEPALAVALDLDNTKNLRDLLCQSLDRLDLSNLHLTKSDLKDIYNACPRLMHFSVRDCTLDRDVLLQFLPQSLRVLDLSNNVWVTDLWLVDLLRQHHFKSDQLVHVFVANCASISRQSIARLNLEYQGRVRIIRSKTANV
jgi:hypothetical protein